MSDLLKRLRDSSSGFLADKYEAADRIEALEKQNAELLAALKELVKLKDMKTYWDTHPHMHHVRSVIQSRTDYLMRKTLAWHRAYEIVQTSTNQEVSE